MISQSLDRFFDSVGARPPLRIDVSSRRGAFSRTEEFRQPFALVGAHDRADLVLKDSKVSRRQLYLQVLGGRLFAVHLSARVPTFFGSEPLPAGWVVGGENLRFGRFELGFPGAPGEAVNGQPQNPLAAGSFSGPPVTLELKNGRPGANRAVIDRTLTLVGNDPVCKLRLNSSRVSAIHCSLVRTARGLWVVDLASTEGVFVNDVPVRCALLGAGDVFEVSGRRLEVHYSGRGGQPLTADQASQVDGTSFSSTEVELAGAAASQWESASARQNAEPDSDSVMSFVVDKFADYQAQTHQQFQEMMDFLLRAFGNLFAEHREFVNSELTRIEELVRLLAERRSTEPAAPGAPTAHSTPGTAVVRDLSVPLPPMGSGAGGEEIHVWLQKRIEELGARKASLWDRLSTVLQSKDVPALRR
jgi:pSer/pThr/pTyr-binding forkhead associated (FHA) protein